MLNKGGQVTIFIIVAIIIVASIGAYFVFRDSISTQPIPSSLEPVYTAFLTCVEDKALTGIDILESQGGYIELPEFEPGSRYMPFSSQLDFLGNPIPYWYYVSGNNIQKEQVPSKGFMQNQLGEFVASRSQACDFSGYYEQGFEISFQDEGSGKVVIKEDEVELDLSIDLVITKNEDTVLIKDHKVVVSSNLGKLYDNAKEVYDYEQTTLFLENYAVDNLRNYAPVDGVEISCSPQVWNAEEVFDELEEGIEVNTLALRARTNDFKLVNKENEYFIVDLPVDSDVEVKFLNSRNWANGFEVNPSQGPVMISEPVGNQQGLGILGFCYVPYHYVYNLRYPVLIQVSSGSGFEDEVFQFPVAIVIEGNQPREALDFEASEQSRVQLCEFRNTLVEVNVFDTRLNSIEEADISYECFSESCEIGKTNSEGFLNGEFPQCVNGFVITRAEGYERSKVLHTVTQETSVDVILDRLYEMDVDIKIDGRDYEGNAIVSFTADPDDPESTRASRTVAWPGTRTVQLSEGQYEIQVYIYRNSSIRLQDTVKQQCIDVPRSGIGGILGLSKRKCFDIEIPSQIISNALSGGGTENYFVLESELENSGTLVINSESLPIPKTIENLQDNYALFETKDLDISFV